MPRFPFIVLLTDFGTKDIYVASMKGVILSLFPEAKLLDLTHEVEPQNVAEAAYLLDSSYRYFPKRTVFVSVVDPGVGSERRILAAKTPRGIFLAPDNGLLTRVLEREKTCELRSVTNRRFFLPEVSSTFHGRDCFSPTAAQLAKNARLFAQLGPRIKQFVRLHFREPRVTGRKIEGEIIFFDHFGNAFTNVSRAHFDGGKTVPNFTVKAGGKEVGPARRSYYEAGEGRPVAVFSSSGLLEIAVNKGSAREKLGLRRGAKVEIKKV